jgi:DNA-directed RNA polymerase subunit N (RpoN/RPB10)
MAKFRHFFISGLLWIAIWVAVVAAGIWLRDSAAPLVRILGVVLQYGGAIMAGLSLWQLARVTRLEWRGRRLARQDPEEFARLAERFRSANEALEPVEAKRENTESTDTAYPNALPARLQALSKIKEKVTALSGLDRRCSHRMLVAAAEVVENILSFPDLGLEEQRMTPEAFLRTYKLVLGQLTFTFFFPDSEARENMASLVTHLTDEDADQTVEFWWEFEQCLELHGSTDDIRSLTAEIAAQRVIRLLGGREDAAGMVVLCFVGPSDGAFKDLQPEFS